MECANQSVTCVLFGRSWRLHSLLCICSCAMVPRFFSACTALWGKVELVTKQKSRSGLAKGLNLFSSCPGSKFTVTSGGETNTWRDCAEKMSDAIRFFSWVRTEDATAGVCTLLGIKSADVNEDDVASCLRDGTCGPLNQKKPKAGESVSARDRCRMRVLANSGGFIGLFHLVLPSFSLSLPHLQQMRGKQQSAATGPILFAPHASSASGQQRLAVLRAKPEYQVVTALLPSTRT